MIETDNSDNSDIDLRMVKQISFYNSGRRETPSIKIIGLRICRSNSSHRKAVREVPKVGLTNPIK